MQEGHMSTREYGDLHIGAQVHFADPERVAGMPKAAAAVYRVENLLKTADGATLYTIKSDAEPFERLVSASDLNRG
jgi:predicted lipoprotein with Yx(FWY)xxD motif